MTTPWYSDEEIDDLCAGLSQSAAKVRHLRRLGLKVDRKPNGRPLAWRPEPVQQPQPQAQNVTPGLNIVSLEQRYARRFQRGQKTQGR